MNTSGRSSMWKRAMGGGGMTQQHTRHITGGGVSRHTLAAAKQAARVAGVQGVKLKRQHSATTAARHHSSIRLQLSHRSVLTFSMVPSFLHSAVTSASISVAKAEPASAASSGVNRCFNTTVTCIKITAAVQQLSTAASRSAH
jgi:hypothetical protein